jgi:hypothetical protein
VKRSSTRLLGPELDEDALDAAAERYRPGPARAQASIGRPPGRTASGPRRSTLGHRGVLRRMAVERRAAIAQRAIRRRVGAAAEVEISKALWDANDAPNTRVDDIVIEGWRPPRTGPSRRQCIPPRVIEVFRVPGHGRSPGWVSGYWPRPTGTTPRPWADVRAAAAKVGARFTDDSNLTRRVADPTLHAERCGDSGPRPCHQVVGSTLTLLRFQ